MPAVRAVLAAAAVTAGLVAAAPAPADTLTLIPVADNTLYESSDGSISSGAGQYLVAGRTLRGGAARRALLRFDLAALPAGSTIHSATLMMNVSRNNAGAGTLTIHRVLASWGEGTSDAGEPGGAGAPATPGDATWLHRTFPGTLWTAPGGDFIAAASAAAPVPETTGPVQWTTGLLADLQAWLAAPGGNFGWLIDSAGADSNSARRLDSREHPDSALRPRLMLDFTPPNPCPADFNGNGALSVQDIFDFLAAYFQTPADPRADFNAGGSVSVQDIFDFLAAYFAGCM